MSFPPNFSTKCSHEPILLLFFFFFRFTHITSLSLSYSCNSADYNVKLANGTYTGKGGSPAYTYKLTINDGNAILVSLDKQSNTSLSGTATMTSKNSLQVSLTNLSYNFIFDFRIHTLKFYNHNCPVLVCNYNFG